VMKDALNQLRGTSASPGAHDNGHGTKARPDEGHPRLQQMEAQISQIENGAELATAALLNTLGLDPGTVVAFDEQLAPDSTTADPDEAKNRL